MENTSRAAARHSALLDYGRHIWEQVANSEDNVLAGRVAAPPLRSMLYVPANRRDWVQKCHRYNADAIILDLEDSVPPDEREKARVIIREEIQALSERVSSVWVRVNSEPDLLPLDLEAAVRPGIHVVQLPKVSSARPILQLDRVLGWHEGRTGLAFGSTVISPILETAGGLHRAHEICMSSTRVEYVGAVVAPEGDTARAMHMDVMSDPAGTETFYVRGKVAVDARAAGVQHVIGGTVTDLRPQQEVLRAFTSMNKAMGYSGTLLIHPSHVPLANALFTPSAEALAQALEVLRVLQAHPGRAAVRHPGTGQMVDQAHARHAYWLLSQAVAFGVDF